MGRGSRKSSHEILFQGKFRDYAEETRVARREEEKLVAARFKKEAANSKAIVQKILDKRIGGDLLDDYKKVVANIKYSGAGTIFYYEYEKNPKPTLQGMLSILEYQGLDLSEVRMFPQNKYSLYFFLDPKSKTADLIGKDKLPYSVNSFSSQILDADNFGRIESGMIAYGIAPTIEQLYDPIKNPANQYTIYKDLTLTPYDDGAVELEYTR